MNKQTNKTKIEIIKKEKEKKEKERERKCRYSIYCNTISFFFQIYCYMHFIHF